MIARIARAALASLVVSVLAACSTTKPWINAPIPADAPVQEQVVVAPEPRPIIAAVTLSGGGARAAAFGLGVLRELKATHFELEGRESTLLDDVGLISGVSGGSILASYYAAFGDETFERFETRLPARELPERPHPPGHLAFQPV